MPQDQSFFDPKTGKKRTKKKPKPAAESSFRSKVKKVLSFMHPGGAGVPISKVKKDLEKAGFKGK